MEIILDWSEVWSLLIPLGVVVFRRNKTANNLPVILYLLAAEGINFTCNLIWKFGLLEYNGIPYNGFLYNAHSIIRFFLFDNYFERIQRPQKRFLNKIIRILFAIFLVVDFGFFEKFYNPNAPFSSTLLSVESVLLLVLCLQYYFYKFSNDEESKIDQSHFWIATGLSIYVTINFFLFLLFETLSRYSGNFAMQLWNFVHNISYVVLNLFLAKGLYGSNYERN